jgi:outer membrane protein OmpA-like peptidoglycan-associated protein
MIMNRTIPVIILLLLFCSHSYAQNLVVNPGFEEADTMNIKRTFTNYDCLTGWDFNVNDDQSWYLGIGIAHGNFRYASKVNIGLNPKSGNLMAEIGTLGYDKKGNQGRQNQTFIAGKLIKPLIKGKVYYFEMWYSLNWFSNVASNNIGVFFSDSTSYKKVNKKEIIPDLNSECILYTNPAQWKRLNGFFLARSNSTHFVIGNFSENEKSKYVKIENPYTYNNKEEWDKLRDTTTLSTYFIDDIVVRSEKQNTSNSKFGCEENFTNLKTGQVLPLDNIYFETAKARLLSQSAIQLDELFLILNQSPVIEIEINGHTDNSGTEKYNQTLSENRAKAVYEYLVNKGIAPNRLRYIGYGFQKPLAPNDNALNKAKNRRVVIRILKS